MEVCGKLKKHRSGVMHFRRSGFVGVGHGLISDWRVDRKGVLHGVVGVDTVGRGGVHVRGFVGFSVLNYGAWCGDFVTFARCACRGLCWRRGGGLCCV